MTDLYVWLKLIHVIAACVLFGTGLGIAFFMCMAHRSDDPGTIASTARIVVIADTVFTASAVILYSFGCCTRSDIRNDAIKVVIALRYANKTTNLPDAITPSTNE